MTFIDSKHEEKNRTLKGTLYLVATPIGNLSDISARAVKVLSEVDFIAAEDTRNSMRLLSHLGIHKPMISYFEHNKAERGPQITERLKNGEACALITDAGMPAISDPGEDLVRLCAEEGIPVTAVPGACAAVTALALSALPTGRFTFEGFLPASRSERQRALNELINESRTMVFHEAPHKLKATLKDMLDAFGAERQISLCRELTKLNEDVFRTTIGGAVDFYKENEPRGEFVLVIKGTENQSSACFWETLSVIDHVKVYMEQGLSKNDAIKAAAKDRKLPKNDVYQAVLSAKQ